MSDFPKFKKPSLYDDNYIYTASDKTSENPMSENKPRERNNSAFPTAWDYAVHLEKELIRYKELLRYAGECGHGRLVMEIDELKQQLAAAKAEVEELKAISERNADNWIKYLNETTELQSQLAAAKANIDYLKQWKKDELEHSNKLSTELAAAKAEVERLKEFEFMYKGLQK